MAKISFSKIESLFDENNRKQLIDRLSDLAAVVMMIQDPNARISNKVDILQRFQAELKNIKERDRELYSRLQITSAEEGLFFLPLEEMTAEDWERWMILKDQIISLRKELWGQPIEDTTACEKQIEKERIKSVNKRFNVREGWLPLK